MPFFNKETRKEIELGVDRNIYIPVIASFDTNGNFKPICFRYSCAKESEKVYIDQVLSSRNNSFYGMIFTCQVTINDCQKVIDIYYFYDNHRWSIRE